MGEDFVGAAARQRFDTVSPVHGSPFRAGIEDAAYVPFTDAALVDAAHAVLCGTALGSRRVFPQIHDDLASLFE